MTLRIAKPTGDGSTQIFNPDTEPAWLQARHHAQQWHAAVENGGGNQRCSISVAEPVTHEFAPGLTAECWGYNGRVHGPTIEALEGDSVRIYVTNKLPAPTTRALARSPGAQWHGWRRRSQSEGDPAG